MASPTSFGQSSAASRRAGFSAAPAPQGPAGQPATSALQCFSGSTPASDNYKVIKDIKDRIIGTQCKQKQIEKIKKFIQDTWFLGDDKKAILTQIVTNLEQNPNLPTIGDYDYNSLIACYYNKPHFTEADDKQKIGSTLRSGNRLFSDYKSRTDEFLREELFKTQDEVEEDLRKDPNLRYPAAAFLLPEWAMENDEIFLKITSDRYGHQVNSIDAIWQNLYEFYSKSIDELEGQLKDIDIFVKFAPQELPYKNMNKLIENEVFIQRTDGAVTKSVSQPLQDKLNKLYADFVGNYMDQFLGNANQEPCRTRLWNYLQRFQELGMDLNTPLKMKDGSKRPLLKVVEQLSQMPGNNNTFRNISEFLRRE